MNLLHSGMALTFLIFLPLSVAASAPPGWMMLVATGITLVLQIGAVVCLMMADRGDDDAHGTGDQDREAVALDPRKPH